MFRDFKKFALIGLANCFTIIGMIIATFAFVKEHRAKFIGFFSIIFLLVHFLIILPIVAILISRSIFSARSALQKYYIILLHNDCLSEKAQVFLSQGFTSYSCSHVSLVYFLLPCQLRGNVNTTTLRRFWEQDLSWKRISRVDFELISFYMIAMKILTSKKERASVSVQNLIGIHNVQFFCLLLFQSLKGVFDGMSSTCKTFSFYHFIYPSEQVFI